jgi:hypothetical protein
VNVLQFRIVELTKENGDLVYVVEKSADGSEWESIYRTRELEQARDVKRERELKQPVPIVSQRVIE